MDNRERQELRDDTQARVRAEQARQEQQMRQTKQMCSSEPVDQCEQTTLKDALGGGNHPMPPTLHARLDKLECAYRETRDGLDRKLQAIHEARLLVRTHPELEPLFTLLQLANVVSRY